MTIRKRKNRNDDTVIYSSLDEDDEKVRSGTGHLGIVFVLFAASRLISSHFNNINDCDETFNYWEPAHFLLYGNGFQTWEYSPQYAIRSYFYLWLYMIPASFFKFLGFDKVSTFYMTRQFLAIISALVETFFYRYSYQLFKY